jgi:hypothetical protein
MHITISIVSFIAGAVLLLIATIGGGFELRELKVPKVDWRARTLALLVGVAFVGLGIVVRPTTPVDPGASIDFTVTDQLGDSQISEQVEVEIDKRSVGALTVDTVHPTASLTVTIDQAGTHEYLLHSTAVFSGGAPGDYLHLTGVGSGSLTVAAGQSFAVAGDVLDDGTMMLSLR